jgi:hypothetical protein
VLASFVPTFLRPRCSLRGVTRGNWERQFRNFLPSSHRQYHFIKYITTIGKLLETIPTCVTSGVPCSGSRVLSDFIFENDYSSVDLLECTLRNRIQYVLLSYSYSSTPYLYSCVYLLGTRSLGSNFDLYIKVRCWHRVCGALASPHWLTLG